MNLFLNKSREHKRQSENTPTYFKPMFWRLILAFTILNLTHQVFGADQPPANSAETSTWSMIISPESTKPETTITTFTLDTKSGNELKQETLPLVEASEQQFGMNIVPENTSKFPVDKTPKHHEAVKPAYCQQDYVRVYNSIPFSRTEYEANPGYRHEATMEILLGQPKPVTIIKQEIKHEPVLLPLSHSWNPYVDPWYLTRGYPNLGTTRIYSNKFPSFRQYGDWAYHSRFHAFGR